MRYFTHIQSGEPHEPKTLICAHHSYRKIGERVVVCLFDYTVHKQSKDFKQLIELKQVKQQYI
jgi:hypothetical protein